ncbi:UBX domain-containing protein 6 [Plecturocebus cupreus]
MAAAAALTRREQKQSRPWGPTSQDTIRNQVRKELQAEATVSGSREAPGANRVSQSREDGSAHLAVPGVCFTCPLTWATPRKDQPDACIKGAILSRFSTDPVAASIMKIHTFSKARDQVKLGVDTIAKYLDNIHLQPKEEKCRKIKCRTRSSRSTLTARKGPTSFLRPLGSRSPRAWRGTRSSCWSQSPCAPSRTGRADFQPSTPASHFHLPGDFNLTAEEIKQEQRLRSEAVERLSVLRTDAKWEKEEPPGLRKGAPPRRPPLQGTFYAWERLEAEYGLVLEALQSSWLPFDLLALGRQKLSEDENPALKGCGLVPLPC